MCSKPIYLSASQSSLVTVYGRDGIDDGVSLYGICVCGCKTFHSYYEEPPVGSGGKDEVRYGMGLA